MTARKLAEWVDDVRQRTFDLVADLNDEQMVGPQISIVNPLLWEILLPEIEPSEPKRSCQEQDQNQVFCRSRHHTSFSLLTRSL